MAVALQELKRFDLSKQPFVPHDARIAGISIGIVTYCSYASDNSLPELASSVHKVYAQRHGYEYAAFSEAWLAEGRPSAWGKIKAVEKAMHDTSLDWIVWADCDIFFMNTSITLDSVLLRYAGVMDGDRMVVDPNLHLMLTEDSQMLNTAIFFMRRSAWSLDLLARVWGDENSPFLNHTWWEQAAFAHELLGKNHKRFMDVEDDASVYPREVAIIPQYELNSYHPISSRLQGETWEPDKFVLSFNGVQSLTTPTVASVLHANYYEIFCRLNSLDLLCLSLPDALFSPWISKQRQEV